MCGIVGYLDLSGRHVNVESNFLPAMCNSIAHRGPDEVGMKTIGPAALGMTRLSIIDLKTGQQPITNEDGTIWIVFNGEIYNYQELQNKLRTAGHKLATNSDTETIVHLYEDYGPDCLKFLEGMFSFAIWDENRETLFLARDRMGEKPLHWTIAQNKFVFASEIKGLLSHPVVKKEVNFDALRQYLALEYVPAPNSIFKDIHKLLPGHYLLVKNGQVHTHSYWQPESLSAPESEQQASERLNALLKRSVELRLISDVPLGVFLSGGIDSSIIAAMAAQQVSGSLKTFSIGFSDSSFDESEHARTVANHLNTDHTSFEFSADLAVDTINELWNVLDEPIADASIVPTYFLSKLTRKQVTVALAGEGGDELFGGYPTYQAHQWANWWNYLPKALRKNIIDPALKSLPVSLNNLSFDYKVKRFISAVDEPPIRRHLRWMGSIPIAEQIALLGKHGNHSSTLTLEEDLFSCGNLNRTLMPEKNSDLSLLDTITRLDMATYLPDDLLVKSDRASMAASLEVRLPFLAFPLVEYALSLPSNLKIRGATTKYLLRKVALNYLPENIVRRPKKGFGIPVGKWLKNQFKPMVEELLNESFIKQQGLFDWLYIRHLLQEHYQGRVDRRKEIWTLLMFQYWWHKFFMSRP